MSNKKKKIDDDKKYKKMRALANARNKKYRSNLTEEQKEEKKRKDRERYHKKKALNETKSINEKSDREKRKQRKIWRKNSLAYRQRKKNPALALPENAGQSNSTDESIEKNRTIENKESHQKKRGRREVKRKKGKVYRDNKVKDEQIKMLNRTVERLRKKLHREKKKHTGSPSPNKKVNSLLKGKRVTEPVRRQLLFSYAIKKQLSTTSNNISPRTKKQQLVAKAIGSEILRKYKVQNMITDVVSYKLNRVLKKNSNLEEYTRKKRVYLMTPDVEKSLINFFEDDRISRMLPGKRDFIKKNGVKKQKRVLLSSLERLHKRFEKDTQIIMSYRNFCRWKPFWVRKPQETDRETCACIIHSNVQLLVQKLVQTGTLKCSNNIDSYLDEICCLSDQKVCMLGQCLLCSDINFQHEINDDKLSTYHQWKSVEEVKVIKGKERKIRKTIKQTKLGKISEIITLLKNMSPGFKRHVYYQTHQSHALYEKKKNLKKNEAVIHIDFSENYIAKFNVEIQAMHFGASKTQISLHTGVFYHGGITKSFCTVSNNLEHKAHAVWAHLEPILVNFPNKDDIETIHFWSDGPSSQYRNRYNLNLLEQVIPTIFKNIRLVTWNFNEAGHGKGPMDGVGGTVKRTADDLVRKGADIQNASDLVALKEYFPNIMVEEVEDSTFDKYESMLLKETPPVKGIMKIHQACIHFCSHHQIRRDYRILSCFKCETCKHWPLMDHEVPSSIVKDSILFDDMAADDGSADTLTAKESDDLERPDPEHIQGGVFIVVAVESMNTTEKHRFVAICEGPLDDEGQVEIQFLKSVSNSKKLFKTSSDNQVFYTHYTDIMEILPFPELKLTGDRVTYQFESDVNITETLI